MPWVAHSSLFTRDGQGVQRVSAGAPAVLQWCSSVVGVEPAAHDNPRRRRCAGTGHAMGSITTRDTPRDAMGTARKHRPHSNAGS